MIIVDEQGNMVPPGRVSSLAIKNAPSEDSDQIVRMFSTHVRRYVFSRWGSRFT